MIACSLGDPSVFSTIFDRHFDAVFRYLARRTERAQAEDLAASTFTVAFERRDRFRPEAESARPWLLGIATNLLRNELRADRRATELAARLRHDVRSPSGTAGELADRLALLLRELDPDQLDVLLLYAWEELSYEEIATALAVPVGTVRSRLARARSRLRAGLEAGKPGDDSAQEASG
ncbi:MAG TPA: sigma-70 family RNA polymerase sigma factor [Solirubrobacteraceae bacterium]|nr:sigma-70 family RNA polymerase sigma factor [Solirubrobacteraceae bacterium]